MTDVTAHDTSETKTVPAAVAASLIMVTPRRLQQLVEEGHIPRPVTRDAYSLVGVVRGYLTFLRGDGRAAEPAGVSVLASARVSEIRQRIEAKDKALVREAAQASQNVLDAAAGGLKADLLSIPARVTKDIPLRRRIEAEFEEAFRAAAVRAQAIADDGDDQCPHGARRPT